MIRPAPVAGAGGFRREEFGAAWPAPAVIFFICPYGTSISAVRWAIRRLCRAGYHVVAYETTTAVFLDGDPAILPGLIATVRTDIQARIARLRSEGVTEFGFFGSSLGSFILYNCVGDAVPELRWGVFNTGGDIAQGMWRLEAARQAHVRRGWSLDRLEAAWAGVQWPEFRRLDGCRYVFAGSRRDTIAPLGNIAGYLGPMRPGGCPGERARGARHRPLHDHRGGPVAGAAVRRAGAVRPANPGLTAASRAAFAPGCPGDSLASCPTNEVA